MRVLQVSSEMVPWVKTGGLADVTGALPAALAAFGVELRPLLPGYPVILQALHSAERIGRARLPWGDEVDVLGAEAQGCNARLYLIDAPWLYARAGSPYEDGQGHAFADNHRRFAALAWVARELACGLDPSWQPQVVHAHDWHAGLAPAYLAWSTAPDERCPSVFTIHNLAYQGLFRPVHRTELGIPAHAWHLEGVEFFGQISFMKAGIVHANQVSTVSAGYAREIQTPEQGFGLDGLLRHHRQKLCGIRNGIDAALWNPAHDDHLASRYNPDQLGARAGNREAIGLELGLAAQHEAPRCAVISRLHPHKGLGLVLEAAPQMLQDGAQVVILGRGEASIEQAFLALEQRYPQQVRVRLGFDEALAHRLLAGCDMLLMPSQFEPCGLTQMYAMRYGCLPLVHAVGGLADTVHPWDPQNPAVAGRSGFVFATFQIGAFLDTWAQALACWAQPVHWEALQRTGMSLALDWDEPAQHYTQIYQQLGHAHG
jgi:starch synthase